MNIQLSDHFNYKKLLTFTLPSIAMMIFTSIYGVVDGFFVSNFVGETAFVAVNFIMPVLMILGAVGFMFGSGGSALIAKTMGQGDIKKANKLFSMFVYVTSVCGIILAITGIMFLRPMASLLGAEGEMLEYCVTYGTVILSALPFYMLQYEFQSFFVTAEKARLGLYVTVAAGGANILLDALFVVGFNGGLVGAAIATALSQAIGGILPLFYFARKNDSLLRLGKCSFEGKVLLGVCFNGMSELMTNISMSVVTIFYNAQLMRLVGISGVSAYGIMMYLGFIFIAAFLGYSVGYAPIVGYDYGADNRAELKNIFIKSIVLTLITGIAMTLIAVVFAKPLSRIFTNGDEALLALTTRGLRLYALSFLLSGLNIFASSFFTALSNGLLSLLISFFRMFLCQIVAVLVLPILLGVDGIWLAAAAAELITLFLSVVLILWQRKRYGYL